MLTFLALLIIVVFWEDILVSDLFERESEVLEVATAYVKKLPEGQEELSKRYASLVREYARLLRQLRRVTKLTDRTTDQLNTDRLDLMDKVSIDSLTQVHSRRYLDSNLPAVLRSLTFTKKDLSVLMIDIDHFKYYNDTYGHSDGDKCLTAVAQAINSCVERPDDFVARYGGEEFIAVLPNTAKLGCDKICEKIMGKIAELKIENKNSPVKSIVSVSIGATTSVVFGDMEAEDFIRRADEALYCSKNNGRDRYTHFEMEE